MDEVIRAKILRLQATMEALPEGQKLEPEVTHFFEDEGVYGRAMLIPAGSTLVGKIHRHAHHNHIHFGEILVASEFGVFRYIGENDFVSQPGTKRVVHALQDTLWITYHDNPTNTRDLLKLEADIIAPSYAALEFTKQEALP